MIKKLLLILLIVIGLVLVGCAKKPAVKDVQNDQIQNERTDVEKTGEIAKGEPAKDADDGTGVEDVEDIVNIEEEDIDEMTNDNKVDGLTTEDLNQLKKELQDMQFDNVGE